MTLDVPARRLRGRRRGFTRHKEYACDVLGRELPLGVSGDTSCDTLQSHNTFGAGACAAAEVFFGGKMITIGLTGGIASGKSTVAESLKSLGAVVIDADRLGHRVYEPGSPGFQKVVNAFVVDRGHRNGRNIAPPILDGQLSGIAVHTDTGDVA